ncbi:MAG: DUF1565 domain-containing protein [Candidatus Cloacimonetes bacterium]|jgi:hypothetical protein|nr:DUF1565 domain-containing protein [Candidatus Cloacimonadota bacterium]MDY0173143.1 DUF1565 domain-containing protein [Candidatus Cloacimonadaceae bacterium]
MKKYLFICSVMLLSTLALSGLSLTVSLDGSAQFTSIQSAIEAANTGDIVLVYPGRYYENLDTQGKSISINSLEASTGDSTYISSTIVDGGRQAPCVSFKNGVQNASLRGFTLTNGLGAPQFTSQMSVGGGILIYKSYNVTISNCDVWGNYALLGAGVHLYRSSAVFSGLSVHHNFAAAYCGGMMLWGHQNHYPNIVFDPNNLCSIYENYGGHSTDIEVIDIHMNLQINLDMVSVENPSDFYIQRNSNFIVTSDYQDTVTYQRSYRTEVNHDLYVSPDGNDSNSGFDPSQALRTITLAMHKVAADSLNRNTVRLLPGTYTSSNQIFPIPLKSHVNLQGSGSEDVVIFYEANNGISASVVVGSGKQQNLLLSGITIRGTGEYSLQVRPISISLDLRNSLIHDVVVEDFLLYIHGIVFRPRNCTLSDFVLRNCKTPERAFSTGSGWVSGTLKNCVFENIESLNAQDGDWILTVIDFWVSEEIKIENCVFRNISVQDQQFVLHVSNHRQDNKPVNIVINNTVFDNLSCNGIWPIAFGNRDVNNYTVSNCTFVNNYGARAAMGTCGRTTFRNNIMFNPEAPKELYVWATFPLGFTSHTDLDYNLIHGGLSGISPPLMGNTLVYGQNNINADPGFESIHPYNPMYLRLSASSPCINAGTPDITGLALPPYDLAGNWRIWNNVIDIGCYEYGSEPWVSNDDPVVPSIPAISLTAYPNPFRAFTNLKVNLPSGQDSGLAAINQARITIYNLKGQKVKTIKLDAGKSGEQITYWDGRDADSVQCSSGIYFINLLVNGRTVRSRKVTFIR